MAGVTDSPFRRICRRSGAGLLYTECISAEGLRRGSRASWELCRFEEEERPIALQLFGSDPDAFAEASALIADRVKPDIIDINCGCPVRKFVTRGCGGALMEDPDKIGQIVEAVRKASGLPVTVKLRAGYHPPLVTAPQAAQAAEEAGAIGVAVHARFVRKSQGTQAQWEVIGKVKETVRSIPVIGNGDLRSYRAVREMMKSTGCDRVMIARWAQGAPWVFTPLKGGDIPEDEVSPPDLYQRVHFLLHHLYLAGKFYGEEKAIPIMRKHCLWYLRDFPCAAQLRRKVVAIDHFSQLIDLLQFWQSGLFKPSIPASYNHSIDYQSNYQV